MKNKKIRTFFVKVLFLIKKIILGIIFLWLFFFGIVIACILTEGLVYKNHSSVIIYSDNYQSAWEAPKEFQKQDQVSETIDFTELWIPDWVKEIRKVQGEKK